MKTKTTLKFLIATLLLNVFAVKLYAQITPEFKFYLAFEDGIGNKDTIYLGYDSYATQEIDTIFGEEDLFNTPFSGTFDVRVVIPVNEWWLSSEINGYSDSAHFYSDGTSFHTKTQIFNFDKLYPYITNNSKQYISVYCKNYPIKVSWADTSIFLVNDRYGSLLTNWFPNTWFDVLSSPYEENPVFFRETSKCEFDVLPHCYINANNDTIALLFFAFATQQQIINNVNLNFSILKNFEIYPTVSDDGIFNISTEYFPTTVNIYNYKGNKILTKTITEPNTTINLYNEINGLYFFYVYSKTIFNVQKVLLIK